MGINRFLSISPLIKWLCIIRAINKWVSQLVPPPYMSWPSLILYILKPYDLYQEALVDYPFKTIVTW